jgi:hypothetical protein
MCYDIRYQEKQREDCFVKNTDSSPSDRQTLKSGEYPEAADTLYTWFLHEPNRLLFLGKLFERRQNIFKK